MVRAVIASMYADDFDAKAEAAARARWTNHQWAQLADFDHRERPMASVIEGALAPAPAARVSSSRETAKTHARPGTRLFGIRAA